MFTALDPKRGCSVCEEANNEFIILANSFRFSASYTNTLYFASLDFDDGQEVFQMVRSKARFKTQKFFVSLLLVTNFKGNTSHMVFTANTFAVYDAYSGWLLT